MQTLKNIIDLMSHSASPDLAPEFDQSEINALREFAEQIAKDLPPEDPTFRTAGINLGSVALIRVIRHFDPRLLNERMRQKPELFFQLLHALAALVHASVANANGIVRERATPAASPLAPVDSPPLPQP